MKNFEPILQMILAVAIIAGGVSVYDMGSKTNSTTELISFKLDSISHQLNEIKTPASRAAAPEPVQGVQKVSYTVQNDAFALDEVDLGIEPNGSSDAGRLKEQLDRLETMIAGLQNTSGATVYQSAGVVQASAPMQAPAIQVPAYSAPAIQVPIVTETVWEVPSVPVAPAVPSGYGSTGTAPTQFQSSQFTRSVQNFQPRSPIRTGLRNLLGVPSENVGSGRRVYCVDQFGRRVSCN